MSQPPGQHGGPPDQPDPYGRPPQQPGPYGPPPSAPGPPPGGWQPPPPGQPWGEQPTSVFGPPLPPYGQQPTQVFGSPGPYAVPGPYGPGGYGRPPRRPNTALPWIVVAVVVVLAAAGVGAFLLLGGHGGSGSAAASTSADRASSAARGPATAGTSAPTDLSGIPGGASPPTGSLPSTATGGGSGADDGRFSGSGDAATQWLQAMYEEDFDAAYDLSCADVQATADRAAEQSGGDAAQVLGDSFYDGALGGKDIDVGQLQKVEYDADADEDTATFALQLEDGTSTSVVVYVTSDLTVCDWTP